jgi:hypothetical protein
MNSSLTMLKRRHIMNITRLSRTGPATYFVGILLVALMTTLGCNTHTTDNIRPNECSELKGGHRDLAKCEEDKKLGIDTVKGEVLHIEKSTYVVQRFYGKEMQLNTDASTQVTGPIGLGDSIEAKVLEENAMKHVMSIRLIR